MLFENRFRPIHSINYHNTSGVGVYQYTNVLFRWHIRCYIWLSQVVTSSNSRYVPVYIGIGRLILSWNTRNSRERRSVWNRLIRLNWYWLEEKIVPCWSEITSVGITMRDHIIIIPNPPPQKKETTKRDHILKRDYPTGAKNGMEWKISKEGRVIASSFAFWNIARRKRTVHYHKPNHTLNTNRPMNYIDGWTQSLGITLSRFNLDFQFFPPIK